MLYNAVHDISIRKGVASNNALYVSKVQRHYVITRTILVLLLFPINISGSVEEVQWENGVACPNELYVVQFLYAKAQ